MESTLVVHEHALKHGLKRDDVTYAWLNFLVCATRVPGESEIRIGVDRLGRRVELVGSMLNDGRWIIYHAITPPTKKVLREIDRRMRRR